MIRKEALLLARQKQKTRTIIAGLFYFMPCKLVQLLYLDIPEAHACSVNTAV